MDLADRVNLVNLAITAFAEDLEYVTRVVAEEHVPCSRTSGLVVWGSPPVFVEEGPDR